MDHLDNHISDIDCKNGVTQSKNGSVLVLLHWKSYILFYLSSFLHCVKPLCIDLSMFKLYCLVIIFTLSNGTTVEIFCTSPFSHIIYIEISLLLHLSRQSVVPFLIHHLGHLIYSTRINTPFYEVVPRDLIVNVMLL